MDRGAWWATIHGVTKSWTWLSDQPWDFFGRNDTKAETPVLWPPHVKSWLIGKDSDARRDWGQEKGTTEDVMAGWHHCLYARESEWTPGVGDGQGGLACCDLWGHKESDTTERLNWTELSDWTQAQAWYARHYIWHWKNNGEKTHTRIHTHTHTHRMQVSVWYMA